MSGATLLSSAKTELIEQSSALPCCRRALLSGYLHTAGSILIGSEGLRIRFSSDSAALNAKITGLANRLYGLTAKSTGQETVLSGNTAAALFDLGILAADDTENPVVVPGVPKAFMSADCCRVNYLRGAFLGAGGLSMTGGYRLSFTAGSALLIADLKAVLNSCGIAASVTKKKDKHILLITDLTGVSDCLALLGAGEAVLLLQSESVVRNVRQNANRASNCEIGNIGKLVDASMRQTEAIERLKADGRLEGLPPKLKEAAELRLEYPEDSLAALAARMGLSKSALNYRLEKLVRLSAGGE